jgi:ferritin-like metal-binding protein YciE
MAKKKTKSGKSGGYGNLHELLILKLQSLYDIEQELVKALEKMAKNATSDDLREAFEEHREETIEHGTRLERALKLLGAETKKTKVAAIRGLVEDGSWVIKNVRDDAARDAALIAAAQYVERYETAGYGTAKEWAQTMGHTEVADLLDQTLQEEEAANQKLTTLAESGINETAAAEMEEIEA